MAKKGLIFLTALVLLIGLGEASAVVISRQTAETVTAEEPLEPSSLIGTGIWWGTGKTLEHTDPPAAMPEEKI